MKRIISICLAFIMLFSVSSYAKAVVPKDALKGGMSKDLSDKFKVDVKAGLRPVDIGLKGADIWARKEIKEAVEKGLIPQNLLNNFRKPITREEFCILAIKLIEVKSGKSVQRLLKEKGKKVAPKGTFKDCDTYQVRAAKAFGITDGTSATTFSPNALLTREQAAKFLTTTAIICGAKVEVYEPDYSDKNAISDWAKPYIGYLKKINVMKGVGNSRFDPKGKYQRQQSFVTMNRLYDALGNVVFKELPDWFNSKTVKDIFKQILVDRFTRYNPNGTNYRVQLRSIPLNGSDAPEPLVYDVLFKNMGNNQYARRVDIYEQGISGEPIKYKGSYVYKSETNKTMYHLKSSNSYRVVTQEGDKLPIPYLTRDYYNSMINTTGAYDFKISQSQVETRPTLSVMCRLPNNGRIHYEFDEIYKIPIEASPASGPRYYIYKFENDYDVPAKAFDINAIMVGVDSAAKLKGGYWGEPATNFTISETIRNTGLVYAKENYELDYNWRTSIVPSSSKLKYKLFHTYEDNTEKVRVDTFDPDGTRTNIDIYYFDTGKTFKANLKNGFSYEVKDKYDLPIQQLSSQYYAQVRNDPRNTFFEARIGRTFGMMDCIETVETRFIAHKDNRYIIDSGTSTKYGFATFFPDEIVTSDYTINVASTLTRETFKQNLSFPEDMFDQNRIINGNYGTPEY